MNSCYTPLEIIEHGQDHDLPIAWAVLLTAGNVKFKFYNASALWAKDVVFVSNDNETAYYDQRLMIFWKRVLNPSSKMQRDDSQ